MHTYIHAYIHAYTFADHALRQAQARTRVRPGSLRHWHAVPGPLLRPHCKSSDSAGRATETHSYMYVFIYDR